MAKVDPNGEVANPIRSKLAGDISRPFQVVPPAQESLVVVKEPAPNLAPSSKLAKPKKVLFTLLEQNENDRLVRQLRDAVGSDTLSWSQVNRALWSLLRRAEDQIEERRSAAPRLARPSNGNPLEMAKFEDALSEYLLMLFKDIPRHSRTG